MKNVSEFQKCCGCGRCFFACPTHSITMMKNRQGFFYPSVNYLKCVSCGKCISSCTFIVKESDNPKMTVRASYAVKHNDETVRLKSRSGGIFTAVSDWILDHDGVIYGCELQNCREAIHTRATTKAKRDSFRGSKYIQSTITDCYKPIKEDLKNGKWVLFSGTPCQVNAIKSFCSGINTEKLLIIDVVCHGVPSQKVWSDYLDYLSGKKRNICNVDFRDKLRFGWADHRETVLFDNGDIYSGDIFKELFYSHLILRRDCFDCPFKNLKRVGDITIADCWGIAENYPEFDDNKGVSLALINSDLGQKVFDRLENIETIDVDLQKVLQPALKQNWAIPPEYDAFWKYYYSHSFKKVIYKYVYHLPWAPIRAIHKIKRIVLSKKIK